MRGAMKVLDKVIHDSTCHEFDAELRDDLDRLQRKVRAKKRLVKVLVFLVVLAAVAVVALVFWDQIQEFLQEKGFLGASETAVMIQPVDGWSGVRHD